jgi:hypothetical protein
MGRGGAASELLSLCSAAGRPASLRGALRVAASPQHRRQWGGAALRHGAAGRPARPGARPPTELLMSSWHSCSGSASSSVRWGTEARAAKRSSAATSCAKRSAPNMLKPLMPSAPKMRTSADAMPRVTVRAMCRWEERGSTPCATSSVSCMQRGTARRAPGSASCCCRAALVARWRRGGAGSERGAALGVGARGPVRPRPSARLPGCRGDAGGGASQQQQRQQLGAGSRRGQAGAGAAAAAASARLRPARHLQVAQKGFDIAADAGSERRRRLPVGRLGRLQQLLHAAGHHLEQVALRAVLGAGRGGEGQGLNARALALWLAGWLAGWLGRPRHLLQQEFLQGGSGRHRGGGAGQQGQQAAPGRGQAGRAAAHLHGAQRRLHAARQALASRRHLAGAQPRRGRARLLRAAAAAAAAAAGRRLLRVPGGAHALRGRGGGGGGAACWRRRGGCRAMEPGLLAARACREGGWVCRGGAGTSAARRVAAQATTCTRDGHPPLPPPCRAQLLAASPRPPPRPPT